MKYIGFLVVIFVVCSCGGGSGIGPDDYEEIGIYEYDIENDTQQLIKKIGVNESYPTVRYLNNSNDIVYGRFHSFVIIKENGSEETIDLGSLYIADNFFSISPDNRRILFAGTVIEDSPTTETSYSNRGIYEYDLENQQVQLIITDSINPLHYPVFSHSGDYIVYKSQTYQGAPSSIFMCDVSGGNVQRIATNEYDLLKHAVFSEDDQNILYVENPDKIQMYNIATKETTTLIEDLNLFDGSSTAEYPMLNTYQDHLYYYARVNDAACAQANLFAYSFETNQSTLITPGVVPMSVNSDYLLIKDSFCFGFEATDLKLLDNNGVLIKHLSTGYGGMISSDQTRVVYIYSATKSY